MRIGCLLILYCLVFINTGHAQFKKGDQMAGASVGSLFFNAGRTEVSFPDFSGYTGKTSAWGLRIEPTMGWFITDKTVIGASLNISPGSEKIRYEDNGTTFQEDRTSTFHIGVGAFARHYFNTGNVFMPFGHFGFNTGLHTMNTEGFRYYSGNPDYKNSYEGKSSGGFFANASGLFGFTRMLGSNTGLDIFAGYSFSYNKNTLKTTTSTDLDLDGDIDYTSVNEPTTSFTSHGFILGVGFQVFLTGKK